MGGNGFNKPSGDPYAKKQYWLCVFITEDAGRRGFSFWFKEGTTQKHTQSVKQHRRQPAADRDGCFQKRLKNKGFEQLQREINIAKKLQR